MNDNPEEEREPLPVERLATDDERRPKTIRVTVAEHEAFIESLRTPTKEKDL